MADLHDLKIAYSRRDPGADALRRELARATGATAASYELVCVVAEHAWHSSEACRAEALLRRAAQLADREPDDRPLGPLGDRGTHERARELRDRLARWLVDGLRCDPELAYAAPASCALVDVRIACALMRLDLATLDHVPMMPLDDRWLLVTPIASGGGKLAARCAILVDAILAHHNRRFAATAPHDPSFIGARAVDARLVDATEATVLAATLRRSAWSPSPLYVVDGARFAPLTFAQFVAVGGA
jgi:hypothetical protein